MNIIEILDKYSSKPLEEWEKQTLKELDDNGYQVLQSNDSTRIVKKKAFQQEIDENVYNVFTENNLDSLEFKLSKAFSIKIPEYTKRLDPNKIHSIIKAAEDLEESTNIFSNLKQPKLILHNQDIFLSIAVLFSKELNLEYSKINKDLDLHEIIDIKTEELLNLDKNYFDFFDNNHYILTNLETLSIRIQDTLAQDYNKPEDVIPKIEKLHKQVSTYESKLSDFNNLRKEYHQNLEKFGMKRLKKSFTGYLKEKYTNLENLCETIENTNSPEEIAKLIRKYNINSHPLKQEEIKNRQNKQSKKYSTAKKDLHNFKEDLRFVADHFSPNFKNYANISSKLKRIKKLINNLNTQKSTFQEIIIDPSKNPKIDPYAGRVSADCTDGNPLPFHKPFVYNAKIWTNGSHIGNVYILEDRKNEVLHLEAIQLPTFDTKTAQEFLKEFLPALAKNYEKTNKIKAIITTNIEEHLQSNFSEIYEPIAKITEHNTFKKFKYPNVKYDFQGGEPNQTYNKLILYDPHNK